VGWYSDVEQIIACWPAQYYYGSPPSVVMQHELGAHANLTFSTWGALTKLSASRAVWHWFDQRSGTDTNHPDDAGFPAFP